MGDVELPADYAPKRARERLLPWWGGAAGEAVRRWGGMIWPGVPPRAVMGWTITATGPTEKGPKPDYVRGLWGVERARLALRAREAEALIGRSVSVEETRRGYLGDLEAQAVCGMLNYRAHFEAVCQKCAPELAEVLRREPFGPAAWRVAAIAYSSGPGVVVPLLDACASRLVALPQAQWAPELAAFVAAFDGNTIRARGRVVKVRGKWRAAHCLLRVEYRAVGAVELGRLELAHEGASLAESEELAALEAWVSSWSTSAAVASTVGRLKVLAEGGR